VHHSSATSLSLLHDAKIEGVPITIETCPHYLTFAAEDIPDGATQFKCCPPIRQRENSERLWNALDVGLIEMVVSDHSPCPVGMKCSDTGDFLAAWGGISSLQLRLPIMWTAARARGYSTSRLAEWLCSAPARLAGFQNKKGSIAVGHDADIIIWNPDEEFRVEPNLLHHRHKLTPYAGQTLTGVVKQTYLRGEKIYDSGEFAAAPGGRILRRGRNRIM
jgi:allantoinase